MDSIKGQIDNLREELDTYNYHYYVLDNPVISDFDFDSKLKKLEQLENDYPQFFDSNSPTQRVGSDLTKNFKQVNHQYPMLSLSNTYTKEEITDFYNRIKETLNDDFEIVCELKYDGTSISLIYEKGELVQAITRGDGIKGDDVTANVRTIRSIPLKLRGTDYPERIEMRGEIIMPWNVFYHLNEQRKEQEEQLFANPRNAGSGTLKQQDSKVVASRHLDSYLYYLLGEKLPTNFHYDNLMKVQNWGGKISPAMVKCKSLDEIFAYIDYWDLERRNLPVATDGIVLKVNSLLQQKNLGMTSKFPRWAIAFKFKAERVETLLESISFQVGRTGAVTPVANLQPIALSGSTVKRASLYNEENINNLDLHIDDYVYVEKGGEIIPKITGVNLAKRNNNLGKKILFIQNCPECNTPLVKNEGDAIYYCPNTLSCPPQIKGRIEHFFTRKAMNIGGDIKTVDHLYTAGFIKNIADIYNLHWEDIAKLERWGEKSAKNFINSIQESKNVPYERVLFALGIRYVGETVAKKLTSAFTNIDLLMHASLEELLTVDEVGQAIAESVINYFANEENRNLIDRLKSVGLQFELGKEILSNKTDKLKDLIIVISGTFEKYSRDEYKAMIDQHGGKNSGSISGKTNYILAGENMGPSKLEKAEKLKIPIINEDEFLNMIK